MPSTFRFAPMRHTASLLAALGCCIGNAAMADASDTPLLITQENGRPAVYSVNAARLQSLPTKNIPQTELGSVWKLFVYAYLVEQRIDSNDYQCRGNDAEDVYCCEPGGHIGREDALVRSCGRYFEPRRLGIKAAAWRDFWRAQRAPDWLRALDKLGESQSVPVPALLEALDSVPAEARRVTGQTLLGVVTQARQHGQLVSPLVETYGGMLYAKTWTMPDRHKRNMHVGGAAGWFANGQSFWLGGQGSGIEVLREAAPALSSHLSSLRIPDDSACVEVEFFSRYPLRNVVSLPDEKAVRPGPLKGSYRANFANGNAVDINTDGELRLLTASGKTPRIIGNLGVNEYVARALDREAAAEPQAAARALAIAARSYLGQQAERHNGCYLIRDSSATQRVSPRPASRAARAVADWSSDLVLHDAVVRYHADKLAPGLLSWRHAVESAEAGERFTRILASAFPGSSLGGMQAPQHDDCITAAPAQRWLAANVAGWRQSMQREEGYSEPAPLPAVCMARAEKPYADTERRRIYVRGWQSQEDRIALTHEYLHIAFEGHPRAHDEETVERLARRLIMEAR